MATCKNRWNGRIDPDGRYAVWREKPLERKHFMISKEKSGDKKIEEMRLMSAGAREAWWSDLATGLPPGVLGLCDYIPATAAERGLGSPKEFKSEKQRAARGSTGITAHGRRKVRCGIGLMEFRVGTRNMSMYTGTFPTMTVEEWQSVCCGWSKGLDAFLRGVAYHLKKAGLRPDFVGCVELQTQRLENHGEIGVHLHVVFQGRKSSRHAWAITPKKIHEIWRNTWEKHAPSAQHWCVGNKLERIARSAAAYLGKYLSKGCSAANKARDVLALERIVPCWFVCSRYISRWVEKATCKGQHVGEFLKLLLDEDSPDIVYKDIICIELKDGRVVPMVGFGSTVYRNWAVPPP